MPTIAKTAGASLRKTVAGTSSQSGPKSLTPQETESRRAAVETARGLLGIEGLVCSDEVDADGKAWANGELTTEEVRARIYSRAGLPVPPTGVGK